MGRYKLFLISVPVALVCVGLGLWQLSRLQERRARNAVARGTRLEQSLTGRFDYQRQVVVDGLSMNGAPVVVVVTPLVLPDSTAVFVERGWVPSPDAHTVDLDSLNEGEQVEVRGIQLDPGPPVPLIVGGLWPKHVPRISPATLATLYPYKFADHLVRRENVKAPLRPVPLPELTNGPHLGYAIQWFSFAIIVLVGSVFLNRSKAAGQGTA